MKTMGLMMMQQEATVAICHAQTRDLAQFTILADILIVAAGKPGYNRVEDESEKILRLLNENDGYLPYHDKSKPEDIYDFFGMSKKTFKMTTGNLYRQRQISFEPDGIRVTTPIP